MGAAKTHWDNWHSARGGYRRLWDQEPLTELEDVREIHPPARAFSIPTVRLAFSRLIGVPRLLAKRSR